MKKNVFTMMSIMLLGLLVGCTSPEDNDTVVPEVSYEDGTYRGTFSDKGSMQVGVQFKLEDNEVTEIEFRHLEYADQDYLKVEDDKLLVGIGGQYEEAIKYLEGKDIRENLVDLYEPGDIVEDYLDVASGATIRGNKIVSAVRDGLNRGVYSY